LPEHLRATADDVIVDARRVHTRLADGLEHVASDGQALACFQFMNAVMRDQRIATQVAALRGADPSLSIEQARGEGLARGEAAASWYPFQLAFIIMQLPAPTDPASPARSGPLSKVELLFFPTVSG